MSTRLQVIWCDIPLVCSNEARILKEIYSPFFPLMTPGYKTMDLESALEIIYFYTSILQMRMARCREINS